MLQFYLLFLGKTIWKYQFKTIHAEIKKGLDPIIEAEPPDYLPKVYFLDRVKKIRRRKFFIFMNRRRIFPGFG